MLVPGVLNAGDIEKADGCTMAAVLAGGNGDVGDIQGKPELEQAYSLGKSIE